MKNQIILTALTLGAIVLGTNTVKAQDVANPVAQSATTVATIELADVISINTGATTAGGDVNFVYSTVEDYTNPAGKSVKKPGSLNITSTQNFDVKVRANSDTFENSTNTSASIKLGVLEIIPTMAGENWKGGDLNRSFLSNADQKIVSDATLGSELILDIEYHIPASASKSSDILGKPSGKYTAVVTYTASAK